MPPIPLPISFILLVLAPLAKGSCYFQNRSVNVQKWQLPHSLPGATVLRYSKLPGQKMEEANFCSIPNNKSSPQQLSN